MLEIILLLITVVPNWTSAIPANLVLTFVLTPWIFTTEGIKTEIISFVFTNTRGKFLRARQILFTFLWRHI